MAHLLYRCTHLLASLAHRVSLLSFIANQLPNPAGAPGVREETGLRYKVNGSADMTDLPLVRA